MCTDVAVELLKHSILGSGDFALSNAVGACKTLGQRTRWFRDAFDQNKMGCKNPREIPCLDRVSHRSSLPNAANQTKDIHLENLENQPLIDQAPERAAR